MKCAACQREMPIEKLRRDTDGWICTGDETAKCYEILEKDI